MSEAKEMHYRLVKDAQHNVEIYTQLLKESMMKLEAIKTQAIALGCQLEEDKDASE